MKTAELQALLLQTQQLLLKHFPHGQLSSAPARDTPSAVTMCTVVSPLSIDTAMSPLSTDTAVSPLSTVTDTATVTVTDIVTVTPTVTDTATDKNTGPLTELPTLPTDTDQSTSTTGQSTTDTSTPLTPTPTHTQRPQRSKRLAPAEAAQWAAQLRTAPDAHAFLAPEQRATALAFQCPETGGNALHVAAATSQDAEVFKTLLRWGCSPLARNAKGQRPRELSTSAAVVALLLAWERRVDGPRSRLFRLCHQPDALLAHVASAAPVTDADAAACWCRCARQHAHVTLLHELAARDQAAALALLAVRHPRLPANVPAADGSGNAPLHEAAAMSATGAARVLLGALGADPWLRNAAGQLPRDLATAPETAALLDAAMLRAAPVALASSTVAVPSRATPDTPDTTETGPAVRTLRSSSIVLVPAPRPKRGRPRKDAVVPGTSPVTISTSSISSTSTTTSTAPSSISPSSSSTAPILRRDRSTGRTLLHRWAARNQLRRLAQFCAAHVHRLPELLNVPDGNGFTPLHEAVICGHYAVAELLVRTGAASVATRARTTGNTPLHDAVASEDAAMARLLVRCAAPLAARNHSGQRPLDLADPGAEALRALLADASCGAYDAPCDTTHTSHSSHAPLTPHDTRRGPGRPRKPPHDPAPASALLGLLSSLTPGAHVDTPRPPLRLALPLLEVCGCDCLLLLRIPGHVDWLFLQPQIEPLLRHIAASARPPCTPDGLLASAHALRPSDAQRRMLLRLPAPGRLVHILKDCLLRHADLRLYPKAPVLAWLHAHCRFALSGPFGYIDCPRLALAACPPSPSPPSDPAGPPKLRLKHLCRPSPSLPLPRPADPARSPRSPHI